MLHAVKGHTPPHPNPVLCSVPPCGIWFKVQCNGCCVVGPQKQCYCWFHKGGNHCRTKRDPGGACESANTSVENGDRSGGKLR